MTKTIEVQVTEAQLLDMVTGDELAHRGDSIARWRHSYMVTIAGLPREYVSTRGAVKAINRGRHVPTDQRYAEV